MFPFWRPSQGKRDEKMDTSSTSSQQSEQSIGDYDDKTPLFPPVQLDSSGKEEDQKQVDICDYSAMFRAYFYSNPSWYAGISGDDSVVSCTLPTSFSPVYSVEKEPSAHSESLKVVVMCVKKNTPFEWTDEYKEPDLEQKIEAYNSMARGMEITLNNDGINFGGHIHVNMNCKEGNCIVEGVVPPTDDDVAKSTSELIPLLTFTEFKLPRNTTEALYIDNNMTTRQMIVKLFEKLKIIDFPKNYALFEYEQQLDETAGTLTKKLTRISDDACPLKVVLSWPIPHSGRALVLTESNCDCYMCDPNPLRVPGRDIVMKVTGLKEEQIHTRSQRNLQNGAWVTTYSKRNLSVTQPHVCSTHSDSYQYRVIGITLIILSILNIITTLYHIITRPDN